MSQGPARSSASGGRDKADKAEGRQGGGGDGMGMGGGMSGGIGLGSEPHHQNGNEEEDGANSRPT